MALRVLLLLVMAAAAPWAVADNPVSWTVEQQLDRGVGSSAWTSPTAIDLGKMIYQYEFEITRITATALITVDITDTLEPELRMGTGFTRALPAALLSETLADEATGTMADVFVEVDDQGFGQAQFSNVVLGTVAGPFGFPINISRVNVTASVMVTGFGPGDYYLSGDVTLADYDAWSNDFGLAGDLLLADGNGDGRVDAADYTVWRDNYNAPPSAVAGGVGVAEPAAATLWTAFLLAVLASGWRARRAPAIQG